MERRILSQEVEVISRFEKTMTSLGLTFQRIPLKKNPDGIHWHIRTPGKVGTLEATYSLKGMVLSLEIRNNRSASWQTQVIETLEKTLAT
jgi:hypothetical protein